MHEEGKNILEEIKCPRCGTKYSRPELGVYVCSVCRFHERMDCAVVRSRYENRKDITIEEAVETAGVEPNRMERIKRELRMGMNGLENSKHHCQKCGTLIVYGRFCENCKKRIGFELRDANNPFSRRF